MDRSADTYLTPRILRPFKIFKRLFVRNFLFHSGRVTLAIGQPTEYSRHKNFIPPMLLCLWSAMKKKATAKILQQIDPFKKLKRKKGIAICMKRLTLFIVALLVLVSAISR